MQPQASGLCTCSPHTHSQHSDPVLAAFLPPSSLQTPAQPRTPPPAPAPLKSDKWKGDRRGGAARQAGARSLSLSHCLMQLPRIPPAPAQAHLVWTRRGHQETVGQPHARPRFRPLAQSPWQQARGCLGAVEFPEPFEDQGLVPRRALQSLSMKPGWGLQQVRRLDV